MHEINEYKILENNNKKYYKNFIKKFIWTKYSYADNENVIKFLVGNKSDLKDLR